MEMLSPVGPVYQAGTLSGNPLAMAAGLAILQILKEENPYPELERKSAFLEHHFAENILAANVKATQTRVGSMFCLFFTDREVADYESAVTSDTSAFAKYFRAMLESGIYLAPSQFEAMFVSTAHSNEDLERTVEANRRALVT